MTPHFNLLDEPWLPVRFSDGRVADIGLLELFEHVDDISALAETNPTNLVAQYRLLLAITHRALTAALGSWKDRDRARWYREGFPQGALSDYLERWRERFWLFHPQFPFMQVAALASMEETEGKQKPWTQIALASANGSAPVMFDHSCDEFVAPIEPAVALRDLLGFLQFTPGGLVKVLRSSDKAGALANTAAALPIGNTLLQTLCLSLHPDKQREDLPSWEQEPLERKDLIAEPRLATGPNDRYTRLSRAALFLPMENGQVQWLRFAVGAALGDDSNAPDPMASYKMGANNLVRLSFHGSRALWRDLSALVPDADGKASHPAAVLGWAANLHVARGNLKKVEQPLLVAGLANEKAKLLRWRSEQIVLPAELLARPQLGGYLRSEIQRAEALYKQVRRIAINALIETMPEPQHKDTRARATAMIDAGSMTATFFAELEYSLPRLLQLIGDEAIEAAEEHWSKSLEKSARATWQSVSRSFGRTPRALRAEARAWPRFLGLLRELKPEHETSNTPATEEELS